MLGGIRNALWGFMRATLDFRERQSHNPELNIERTANHLLMTRSSWERYVQNPAGDYQKKDDESQAQRSG